VVIFAVRLDDRRLDSADRKSGHCPRLRGLST
jgi:hypothetical protein